VIHRLFGPEKEKEKNSNSSPRKGHCWALCCCCAINRDTMAGMEFLSSHRVASLDRAPIVR
jgi:hypothetical protein